MNIGEAGGGLSKLSLSLALVAQVAVKAVVTASSGTDTGALVANAWFIWSVIRQKPISLAEVCNLLPPASTPATMATTETKRNLRTCMMEDGVVDWNLVVIEWSEESC